jgi:chaperonin GroEL (HSP60 family)
MNAQELLNKLNSLIDNGYNLSNIEVSYRQDEDSDVNQVNELSEGLYDAETNSILTEIILTTN